MRIGFTAQHDLNRGLRPVMATISTANFELAIKAYQKELGYQQVNSTYVSAQQASQWEALDLEGARQAILRPESEAPVFLRFIEIPSLKPRSKTCGWFALEICVNDVEALYARLMTGDGFTPFAEPKPMAHTDRVYPMQCKGPAGEILYLNQVRGSLPEIDLPIASCDVDHLFIAILSAANMEASNAFYSELLGMRVNEQLELPYKTINRVHSLALETRHKLSTLGGIRQVALEVDQYPVDAAMPQALDKSSISEGILMVSYTVDGYDSECIPETISPQVMHEMPYNGAKSLMCFGPGGERIELIQLTS